MIATSCGRSTPPATGRRAPASFVAVRCRRTDRADRGDRRRTARRLDRRHVGRVDRRCRHRDLPHHAGRRHRRSRFPGRRSQANLVGPRSRLALVPGRRRRHGGQPVGAIGDRDGRRGRVPTRPPRPRPGAPTATFDPATNLVTVGWAPSTDDVGVAGYTVRNGTVDVGTVGPTVTSTQITLPTGTNTLDRGRPRRRRQRVGAERRRRRRGRHRRHGQADHAEDADRDGERRRHDHRRAGWRRPTTSVSPRTACTATASRSPRCPATSRRPRSSASRPVRHYIQIQAYDAAGNASNRTASVVVDLVTAVDTSNPTTPRNPVTSVTPEGHVAVDLDGLDGQRRCRVLHRVPQRCRRRQCCRRSDVGGADDARRRYPLHPDPGGRRCRQRVVQDGVRRRHGRRLVDDDDRPPTTTTTAPTTVATTVPPATTAPAAPSTAPPPRCSRHHRRGHGTSGVSDTTRPKVPDQPRRHDDGRRFDRRVVDGIVPTTSGSTAIGSPAILSRSRIVPGSPDVDEGARSRGRASTTSSSTRSTPPGTSRSGPLRSSSPSDARRRSAAAASRERRAHARRYVARSEPARAPAGLLPVEQHETARRPTKVPRCEIAMDRHVIGGGVRPGDRERRGARRDRTRTFAAARRAQPAARRCARASVTM